MRFTIVRAAQEVRAKSLQPVRAFSCMKCRRPSVCASIDVCLESACLAELLREIVAERSNHAAR